MRFPNFVGPSYVLENPIADCEELINFFVEQKEIPGAKVQYTLESCPGFSLWATFVGASSVRGLFAIDDDCFAVAGEQLWRIESNGNTLLQATGIVDDGRPVTISSNGTGGGQLFITSGGHGYTFTMFPPLLVDLGTLAANSLPKADYGGYSGGYFLALIISDQMFRISGLLDGMVWDPLDFAQRTSSPDSWKSLIVSHGDVWLFGSATTDVWYNSGDLSFPFAPIPGAQLNYGIAAPSSAALLEGSPVWLSQNAEGGPIVLKAEGYNGKRISTHAIECALQNYAIISDAVGWTYQDGGHPFYVISFPTQRTTWAYDGATNWWHKRGYWDPTLGAYDVVRANCHCFAWGKRHLVGDPTTGKVWLQSCETAIDVDGQGMRRTRTTPHVHTSMKSLFYTALGFDLRNGVGLASGQGVNPQLMLQWSDDGGRTYSNEHWAGAGRMGQYKARVDFTRLGKARDRVFRLVVSDPVPWSLVDAEIEFTVGMT